RIGPKNLARLCIVSQASPVPTGGYRLRLGQFHRSLRAVSYPSTARRAFMTAPAVLAGLEQAPTSHPRLLAWIREVAELTTPDRVVWCDGSPAEWDRLTTRLVEAGALVPL